MERVLIFGSSSTSQNGGKEGSRSRGSEADFAVGASRSKHNLRRCLVAFVSFVCRCSSRSREPRSSGEDKLCHTIASLQVGHPKP
ncbi:hypothetical protein PVAP13_9NG076773 [Panicum virgatum]|uniref:Uncharacterized protein n=1 Tax=Panicum virgatum TaxID=38727 RepID=A0A8T0MDL5_PANVG|nr:hypothetical protein PVAP13_9NG076773 [Panicum virgatum]